MECPSSSDLTEGANAALMGEFPARKQRRRSLTTRRSSSSLSLVAAGDALDAASSGSAAPHPRPSELDHFSLGLARRAPFQEVSFSMSETPPATLTADDDLEESIVLATPERGACPPKLPNSRAICPSRRSFPREEVPQSSPVRAESAADEPSGDAGGRRRG